MTVALSCTYGQKDLGLSVMIAGKIRKGFLPCNENVTTMIFLRHGHMNIQKIPLHGSYKKMNLFSRTFQGPNLYFKDPSWNVMLLV